MLARPETLVVKEEMIVSMHGNVTFRPWRMLEDEGSDFIVEDETEDDDYETEEERYRTDEEPVASRLRSGGTISSPIAKRTRRSGAAEQCSGMEGLGTVQRRAQWMIEVLTNRGHGKMAEKWKNNVTTRNIEIVERETPYQQTCGVCGLRRNMTHMIKVFVGKELLVVIPCGPKCAACIRMASRIQQALDEKTTTPDQLQLLVDEAAEVQAGMHFMKERAELDASGETSDED